MTVSLCAVSVKGLTYTRGSTKIQQDLALLEEAIFLVELDQLEGGTGAVPLLLCELVPLVETTLSMLLLDRHGGQSSRVEAERLRWLWSRSSGDLFVVLSRSRGAQDWD